MLSKCGNVIQQWQKYIPQNTPLNKSRDVKVCLKDIIEEMDSFSCDCPVSCQELLVEAKFRIKECRSDFIKFSYLSNTYTETMEVPAYPASKFITDIGGWLSLFSGMSALSLLEVIIFVPLATITLYKRINHWKRNERVNVV